MPTLAITNFNIVCAVAGGFILLFGLVSYLCKERLFLSEALIALLAGVGFGPHAANWIRPIDYANGSIESLNSITLYFSRLVLGVQLVIAGVQLPSKYLLHQWRSLAYLLGPGMVGMWICSTLIVWGLVPNLPFLHAMAIAACVTPTDPVLSNTIVKGQFADKNIPKDLQRIIVAESGANDGLGYPFLFLPLFLIKYTSNGGESGGAGSAIGMWFGEIMGYQIVLSIAYGAVIGWIAKEALHYAEEKKFVDRESFLVFAITLALFIIGTCGMIGSDDVLACFVAGNVFTIDDWFRLETLDDSIQPTIDMLLNVSVFVWFGAVCPWTLFLNNNNNLIPLYRLIPLGILILLLRRLPIIFSLHSRIHQIEGVRQALFVGFFGPIGVSAVFYLYISLEFLATIKDPANADVIREDTARLGETMTVVIWFLAICSIIVHGLSVPVGKVGYHLPRTISSVVMSQNREDPEPFQIPNRNEDDDNNNNDGAGGRRRLRYRQQRDTGTGGGGANSSSTRPEPVAFRIGGSVVPSREVAASPDLSTRPERRDFAVAAAAGQPAGEGGRSSSRDK